MNHLIELYFVNMNWFPIFHRPTFLKLVEEGLHLHNIHFAATVLCVCAISARFTDDPRIIGDGITTEKSTGWLWFKQVYPIHSTFVSPPTIFEVQRYAVSCISFSFKIVSSGTKMTIYYLQTSYLGEAGWNLTGIAARMLQDIGAHRKVLPSEHTIERELWIRSFWTIAILDSMISSWTGRPKAMNMNE
jgi:hypothetical protein